MMRPARDAQPRPPLPGGAVTTWVIAARAAREALSDRLSLLVGIILAVPVPPALVALVVAPAVAGDPPGAGSATVALYFLVVGVLPGFSAVGIAAGQFAYRPTQRPSSFTSP